MRQKKVCQKALGSPVTSSKFPGKICLAFLLLLIFGGRGFLYPPLLEAKEGDHELHASYCPTILSSAPQDVGRVHLNILIEDSQDAQKQEALYTQLFNTLYPDRAIGALKQLTGSLGLGFFLKQDSNNDLVPSISIPYLEVPAPSLLSQELVDGAGDPAQYNFTSALFAGFEGIAYVTGHGYYPYGSVPWCPVRGLWTKDKTLEQVRDMIQKAVHLLNEDSSNVTPEERSEIWKDPDALTLFVMLGALSPLASLDPKVPVDSPSSSPYFINIELKMKSLAELQALQPGAMEEAMAVQWEKLIPEALRQAQCQPSDFHPPDNPSQCFLADPSALSSDKKAPLLFIRILPPNLSSNDTSVQKEMKLFTQEKVSQWVENLNSLQGVGQIHLQFAKETTGAVLFVDRNGDHPILQVTPPSCPSDDQSCQQQPGNVNLDPSTVLVQIETAFIAEINWLIDQGKDRGNYPTGLELDGIVQDLDMIFRSSPKVYLNNHVKDFNLDGELGECCHGNGILANVTESANAENKEPSPQYFSDTVLTSLIIHELGHLGGLSHPGIDYYVIDQKHDALAQATKDGTFNPQSYSPCCSNPNTPFTFEDYWSCYVKAWTKEEYGVEDSCLNIHTLTQNIMGDNIMNIVENRGDLFFRLFTASVDLSKIGFEDSQISYRYPPLYQTSLGAALQDLGMTTQDPQGTSSDPSDPPDPERHNFLSWTVQLNQEEQTVQSTIQNLRGTLKEFGISALPIFDFPLMVGNPSPLVMASLESSPPSPPGTSSGTLSSTMSTIKDQPPSPADLKAEQNYYNTLAQQTMTKVFLSPSFQKRWKQTINLEKRKTRSICRLPRFRRR